MFSYMGYYFFFALIILNKTAGAREQFEEKELKKNKPIAKIQWAFAVGQALF